MEVKRIYSGIGALVLGLMMTGYANMDHAMQMPGGSTAAGGVSFQSPASWKQTPPSSSMRLYQFEVPSSKSGGTAAELAVFFFGTGMGGGIDANIERWKSQFSSFSQGFTPQIQKKTVNGLNVTTVYLEGTLGGGMPGMPTTPQANYAVLGAIAEGSQGPVFFKMTGPKETVQGSQADFDQLIKTFKAEGPSQKQS